MLATKSNSYTFQKDGIWYFSRRVPADLRRHYRTGRIAYSLRTKSIRDARVRAMSDAAKLDRQWHWKDLSALIAIDPLILLSTEIVGDPYSMAVQLAP
jgi:hypothetical protein